MEIRLPTLVAAPDHVAALDRLGDEIADLSAHLDAATARLLGLIRAFDAMRARTGGMPARFFP
ncbi:MAG: hypothetical protein Q8P98_03410 [Candidatus Rokubacteria bacterium]|nr:hypothetical protein [Candidatus Rokubacteria bacterium]